MRCTFCPWAPIPPKLRQELVDELMAARRAVKAGDSGARRRVDDAKVALGERGHLWWEAPGAGELDHRIAAALRALARKRSETSASPSDIARIVGGRARAWRDLMGVTVLPNVPLDAGTAAPMGDLRESRAAVLAAYEIVTGASR